MDLGFVVGIKTALKLDRIVSNLSKLGSPTVIISSSESSPTSADPIPITFTWSEGVYSFGSASVTYGNGTPTEVIVLGQDLYIINVSPDGPGNVTIDVNADVCVDADGNGNLAADQFIIEAA